MAASLIHLLNTPTRMPFEILFGMLMGAIIFPLALGIQWLHENEKPQRFLVVVFSWGSKGNRAIHTGLNFQDSVQESRDIAAAKGVPGVLVWATSSNFS